MVEDKTKLPEGTDSIIAGASATSPGNSGSIEVTGTGGKANDGGETLVINASTPSGASAVIEKVRSSGEKLSGQAADKARGLVSQGLERSAEALASVSKMVGDSAVGIDERLGAEYGDYARRAAGAIEGAANSLAEKNPDELVDDTRDFVRKSPGIALAGAAIIGFALARLIKSGMPADERSRGGKGQSGKSSKS